MTDPRTNPDDLAQRFEALEGHLADLGRQISALTAVLPLGSEAAGEAVRLERDVTALGHARDAVDRVRADFDVATEHLIDRIVLARAGAAGTAAPFPDVGATWPGPEPVSEAVAVAASTPVSAEPRFRGRVIVRVGPVRQIATLRRIGTQLMGFGEIADVYVAALNDGTAEIELELAGEVDLLPLVRMAVGPGAAIEVSGSTLEVVLLEAGA